MSGDGAVVLTNGNSSPFADVFTIAPSKIFLTQCKWRQSTGKVNATDANTEFKKMSAFVRFDPNEKNRNELASSFVTSKITLSDNNRVESIEKSSSAVGFVVECCCRNFGNVYSATSKNDLHEQIMRKSMTELENELPVVEVVCTVAVRTAKKLTLDEESNKNKTPKWKEVLDKSGTKKLVLFQKNKKGWFCCWIREYRHITVALCDEAEHKYLHSQDDVDSLFYPVTVAPSASDLDKESYLTELTRYEVSKPI